jgi:hypothetical protein
MLAGSCERCGVVMMRDREGTEFCVGKEVPGVCDEVVATSSGGSAAVVRGGGGGGNDDVDEDTDTDMYADDAEAIRIQRQMQRQRQPVNADEDDLVSMASPRATAHRSQSAVPLTANAVPAFVPSPQRAASTAASGGGGATVVSEVQAAARHAAMALSTSLFEASQTLATAGGSTKDKTESAALIAAYGAALQSIQGFL